VTELTRNLNSEKGGVVEKEIVITRSFRAPRELLFRAWSDPELIKQWWGPAGFSNTDCKVDLRVGGKFYLQMCAPDGSVYPCHGSFLEIVEPEKIVYAGQAEEGHPCGSGLPPRSVVTVTFEEHGEETLLTLHTLFESVERLVDANENRYSISWGEGLERLNDTLAGSSK